MLLRGYYGYSPEIPHFKQPPTGEEAKAEVWKTLLEKELPGIGIDVTIIIEEEIMGY